MNIEKMIAEFDAATTTLMRVLPDALRQFFEECQKKGFTEEQALILTRDYFKLYHAPEIFKEEP